MRLQLARGKAKAALEAAKSLHKAAPSPDSLALLVDAYLARLEEFVAQGAYGDASALLEVETKVEDMFRIGAYYRFTRGLDLRDDNWDPWLAAGRQSHELGAAARFVTSFD